MPSLAPGIKRGALIFPPHRAHRREDHRRFLGPRQGRREMALPLERVERGRSGAGNGARVRENVALFREVRRAKKADAATQ